jgi:TPR repeat protein
MQKEEAAAQPVKEMSSEAPALVTERLTPGREGNDGAQRPDVIAMTRRGDSLLAIGDVASARLFYDRAADSDDAAAAMRLAHTYDPDFLALIHVSGTHANNALAIYWYERAYELGTPEARIMLQSHHANSQSVP